MVVQDVLSRMKERHDVPRLGIASVVMIALPKIAGPAGKREIVEMVTVPRSQTMWSTSNS